MGGGTVPLVGSLFLRGLLAFGLLISVKTGWTAQARITRVTKIVQVLTGGSARPAKVNGRVADGSSVRTGVDSQTELVFDDQTLARLAGKTLFSFHHGDQQMNLSSGAMLVRAPGAAHGAEVRADVATVAVRGATCLLEHNAGKYVKLVVLQGTARMFLKSRLGESVLVEEGQLLMFHLGPKLNSLPNPVDVDIKRLMATSQLIHGFAPIGNESSINQGIDDQKKQKTKGVLVDTNLVIYGRGTVVSLTEPTATPAAAAAKASPTPSPTAPSSPTSR